MSIHLVAQATTANSFASQRLASRRQAGNSAEAPPRSPTIPRLPANNKSNSSSLIMRRPDQVSSSSSSWTLSEAALLWPALRPTSDDSLICLGRRQPANQQATATSKNTLLSSKRKQASPCSSKSGNNSTRCAHSIFLTLLLVLALSLSFGQDKPLSDGE